MSVLGKFRQVMRSYAIAQASKRLSKNGAAKRAPTYALIQVEASQTGLLASQISFLSEQFDRVLAVWPDEEHQPKVAKNVEIFTPRSSITSRWQLLSRCTDGFVFPISLIKPIQKNHVEHLKKHLFAVGGANSVGLYNFGHPNPVARDENEPTQALVPMPSLDLDYVIIDQRFWKLKGTEFYSADAISEFALEAHSRDFGLFACNDPLAESNLPKHLNLVFSRFELVEMALRNPKVLQKLTPDGMQLWTKSWDSFGAKRDSASPSELLLSTGLVLEKNVAFAKTSKLAARKLMGTLKKQQGVRS